MITSEFNDKENRSLSTVISRKYRGGENYQKGPSAQTVRDMRIYVTNIGDENMQVASLEIYAPAIETREHNYIITQPQEWFEEQASNWSWENLTASLLVFMRGVGIKTFANHLG